MAAAQALTLRDWDEDAVRAFYPVVDTNPWGPLENAGELLSGAFLAEYREGTRHALVAARPVQLSGGVRVEIVGLRSLGDRLPADLIAKEVVKLSHALGGNLVAMSSRVPHILSTLNRHGWATTGALMVKALDSHGRTQ